jgi:hypothetical protein
LSKVLQGESVATSSTKEIIPSIFETRISNKQDTKENPKNTEDLTRELEALVSTPQGPQAKAHLKVFLKQGHDISPSTPATSMTNIDEKQLSKETGTPITSLTPLQSSFRNLSFEVIFIDDLTPIAPEEMPPSNLFFNKKMRVIVKQETHQKDGAIVKRKRMVCDGHNRDDSKFAKEMEGSLGAFATENQWSVENLVEKLK